MSYPNWPGPAPDSQDEISNPMSKDQRHGYQAPYGYPSPYGHQAPYGYGSPPPPDYRGWILAAVIGGAMFSDIIGLPLSLVAWWKSRRVRRSWESGDQNGAAKASRSARSLVIAATIFDVLGLLLFIIVISQAYHL